VAPVEPERPWWVMGGAIVLLLGAGLFLVGFYLWSRPTPPEQPIRFSHQVHVKQVKCGACHLYVTKMAAAGTPPIARCMMCHSGTQSKTPEALEEEAKIKEYAEAGKEIPWVRISTMAPHVYFSHRRHVVLEEIQCAACHGDIAETVALPDHPAHQFTMDFCMDCHETSQATLDCLACHR
jgi:hypothetical protein